MFWVFLLLGILGLSSAANIGISYMELFGRQASCSGCLDTEKCCGTSCISADWECCQTDPPVWCPSSAEVCEPCPAGLTCYAYDDAGDSFVEPWNCCENGVCYFTVATGTIVSTISTASSQTSSQTTPSQAPAASTPSSISASSIATAPPSSPANPPPVSTVIYTVQTTSTLPASSTVTTPAFTPFTPTPTPTQTSFSVSLVTASNTVTFFTSTTSSSTYSSIPPWNGSGDLLVGYCATPEFSLVYGPQTTAVYFIGVVGCVGDKSDCCPFQVSSTTSTVTETVTQTVGAGLTTTVTQTAGAGPPVTNQFLFPIAASSSQITLPRCPEDYETVSSVCCPSGYLLWDTLLGGITPCYSTTSNYLTPPPILEPSTSTSSAGPATVTSTIINVVYAMHYPVKSAQSGLSTPAEAGIGVGSALAAVAAASALFYFLWRRRRRRSWYSDGRGTSQSDDSVSGVPP